MPHRLFIAIRPPAAVRDALVDSMEGLEGARWLGEDQLHLTLRFVGEVETPAANDLAGQLARIDSPPFELAAAGVGVLSAAACLTRCGRACRTAGRSTSSG